MTKWYAIAIAALLIYYLGKWLLPGIGRSVVTPLPGRLQAAKIWAKERAFAISKPVAIHGVIDEGFKLEDGTIVLSDTKSRANKAVYRSDILQVSAYKLLVESAGNSVSDRGYIRVLSPNGNEYVPVNLLDEHEVVQAVNRYQDLRSGADVGEKCQSKALCRKCPYKAPCDEMAW